MSRDELFDLAIQRALSYTQKLHLNLKSNRLKNDLELWYLKTRFAYRIPLDDIVTILQTCPAPDYQWQGGKNGQWIQTRERL